MRSFFYRLDSMTSDAQTSRNLMLQELCYDIKNYVMSGDFTDYKKVKTILNFWGYPDNYVTKMTGMKEATVRVARRNLSNELYEQFGYDFFEVVGIGDEKAIAEGRARLNLVRKGFSADRYLSFDLIQNICSKAEMVDDVDITSCAFEIQFLVRHSKQSLERELAMLDVNKLAYLIRLLNNETGSLSTIHKLVKCFEKEDNSYE